MDLHSPGDQALCLRNAVSFLHPTNVLRMQPDPWLAVPSACSLENPEGRLFCSSPFSVQQHHGQGASPSPRLPPWQLPQLEACHHVSYIRVWDEHEWRPHAAFSTSREHLQGKGLLHTSFCSLLGMSSLAKAQFLSWPYPSQLGSGICRAVLTPDFPKLMYKVRRQSGSSELHLLFCDLTPMLAEPYTFQLRQASRRHSRSVGLLYPYVHPCFNQLTSHPSMQVKHKLSLHKIDFKKTHIF